MTKPNRVCFREQNGTLGGPNRALREPKSRQIRALGPGPSGAGLGLWGLGALVLGPRPGLRAPGPGPGPGALGPRGSQAGGNAISYLTRPHL